MKSHTPVLIKDLGYMYPTEKSKQKARFGVFQCRCGVEFRTYTASVKNGNTQSCGCYHTAVIKECNKTHGMRSHPLYQTWKSMIQRCTNPNDKYFANYGGRGITICDEWNNDNKSFFDWALAHGWEEGLSIDRIDNGRGYEPANCRWATRPAQAQNTRAIKSTNKSGYRGVHWNKRAKKWKASIMVSSKNIHLGYFNTALEASEAYIAYVKDNKLEHNYSMDTKETQ